MSAEFPAHLTSLLINFIATIFTGTAILSCDWVVGRENYGLIDWRSLSPLLNCSHCECNRIPGTENSTQILLLFFTIGFVVQCIGVVRLVNMGEYRRLTYSTLRADEFFTGLTTVSHTVALLIYFFNAALLIQEETPKYTFGYSFYMAVAGTGFSYLAYLPARCTLPYKDTSSASEDDTSKLIINEIV